ncbi:MAG: PQQ-binding-like beta-propeller repeat protein, partial [Planctomycetaceae bacterium]
MLSSALMIAALALPSSAAASEPGKTVETRINSWLAAPMDWPFWRGPEQNGVSRETGLVDRWDPDGGEGSNLLWKREDLGGRSTPIVMNGRLYTIVRDQPRTPQEGEKVVCLDAATGETIWENRFNVYLSAVPDTRVGWSSVVGDPTTGNVFALGVADLFLCIDGETGKTLWTHALSEEYGMLNTYGGRTNYPTIHGNLVIVNGVCINWGDRAKPAHCFIAFDKRNGVPVWFDSTRPLPDDTTYSSPILTVLDGQPAMVFGSGDGGFHAKQPQTGKTIWTYDASMRGINTTPLVVDGVVYGGHSEENVDIKTLMGAVFAVDGTQTGDVTKEGEIWRVTEKALGRIQPIMVDGKLIAIEDGGNLLIIDPKTGKQLNKRFKVGRMQRASPIYADGKIY